MATEETTGTNAAAEAVPLHNNSTQSDELHTFKRPVSITESETAAHQEAADINRGAPSRTRYRDHYSLAYPSSTVRFRSSATSHRVYEGSRSQFVLEEKHGEITVKRVRDTTGAIFLRAVFTVVTVLWSGFLFVFCTQILIFLVMDLVVYLGGTTGADVAVGKAVGNILSFPLFVGGLSQALIIAGHFIADTWAGGYLMNTLVFGGVRSVLAAWTSLLFFLLLPLFVMGITLFVGVASWWSITAIFWFSSVSVFYVAFALFVIYFEIHACLEIVGNEYDCKNEKLTLLKKCILLRQIKTFSGKKSRVYLARGTLNNASSIRSPVEEEEIHYHESLYTRFTKWPFLQKIGMMKCLEEPGQRTHPIEEAQGVRPFITYTTWSLEKLYCRPRNSWYVAVIKGPAALTKIQMQSSFICAILGNLLVWFLVVAFLVFFDSSSAIIAVFVVIMAIISIPTFRSTLRIYNMAKDIIGLKCNDIPLEDSSLDQDGFGTPPESEDERRSESSEVGLTNVSDSEGVFQVCETYRITEPSSRYCWTMFVFELVLLYLWPLVALYVVNDTAIGSVFLFVGLLSLFRYYLNAAVVLEEVGNMRDLRGKDELHQWKNQSRTSDIIANITRSRSRGPWILVLGFFLVITMLLGVGALLDDNPQGTEGYNITAVPDFSYIRLENSLPYPTCNLDFNVDGLSGGGIIATRDFAFLSAMSYEGNETKLQEQLDSWFGSNVSIDMPEVVEDFRNETNRELSPVTYKLFSFPNVTSSGAPFAVVGIRGSQSAWDWLTNAQLWSGPFGMQILGSFLPFGFIWNPIFDELVKALSIIESSSIKRVSYYVETTDFVEWLQKSGTYAGIKVTGHSLGGGLALITGAQTGVSGVAMSGPNALMLRKSLSPPVSEEALDTYTFNVIPDRDLVPRAGGVARLYENIRCTAAPNDPTSCHAIVRSLCEILYTCGTEGRPALCQCVTDYGYPEPISLNGDSFAEVCGA